MNRLRGVFVTLACALMLVVGLDYIAAATTGKSLILGQVNSANKTTTISNSGSGPALSLKAGGPPLAVSNNKKVKNLNADLLDGSDSSDFLTTRTKVLRVTVN